MVDSEPRQSIRSSARPLDQRHEWMSYGLDMPRWEGDTRGRGIGDAGQLVPGASELIAAFSQPDWVAEEPAAHLRPHIEEWCRLDGRLALREAFADEGSAYILEVEWLGEAPGVGEVRAAVFSLIGSFAEAATYVRQRLTEKNGVGFALRVRFEIGTGELAPETRFLPHGHAVIINVTAAP
jgi:hypothetical protein